MVLEIDILKGRVLVDGMAAWSAGDGASALEDERVVRCLDLDAILVIAEEEGKGVVATVLFDEEEFADSILTSSIVRRFAKKTGVTPEMVSRRMAQARFSWGRIEFSVDPRQGDLSIVVSRR
ncbi:hypothetical protein [Roseateles sp.]|uniref:hypothetical protein n=1 Tax=Roseateles sp. TaxID=1971397 RepID=UPI0031E235AD